LLSQAIKDLLLAIPLTLIIEVMGNILYVVAVILIIGWAIGYFAFGLGAIIHSLLIMALVIILMKIIKGKKIL
jgi:hypothetical protein